MVKKFQKHFLLNYYVFVKGGAISTLVSEKNYYIAFASPLEYNLALVIKK